MSPLIVMTRRIAWVMLIALVGGAAFAWLRDRRGPQLGAPPEWPPLEPEADGQQPAPADAPEQADAPEPAPADAPQPVQADEQQAWCEPEADGSCPDSHQIKVNTTSGIFHVPGGRFYDRTTPHRCYATADAAVADGYRQAKS